MYLRNYEIRSSWGLWRTSTISTLLRALAGLVNCQNRTCKLLDNHVMMTHTFVFFSTRSISGPLIVLYCEAGATILDQTSDSWFWIQHTSKEQDRWEAMGSQDTWALPSVTPSQTHISFILHAKDRGSQQRWLQDPPKRNSRWFPQSFHSSGPASNPLFCCETMLPSCCHVRLFMKQLCCDKSVGLQIWELTR